MNLLFSGRRTQDREEQMRTKRDVSAALMCKQFLKDHFLFKVQKERSRWNKFQHMCIVTIEALDTSVIGKKSFKITSLKCFYLLAYVTV